MAIGGQTLLNNGRERWNTNIPSSLQLPNTAKIPQQLRGCGGFTMVFKETAKLVIMKRRQLLVAASVSFVAGLAGCAGEEDDGSTNDDTATETKIGTTTGGTTGTETQTASAEDVFTGLEIDGTEFVVTVNPEKLQGGSRIKVHYPNSSDSKSLSEGINKYRFDVVNRAQPGTWEVELLDNHYNTVTTAEFEAERNFSLSNIGTLSQLGVSGGSEWREQTTIQFTVENEGPMPLDVQSARFSASYKDSAYESNIGIDVLTAGESADTDKLFQRFLGFTYRENAESRSGESYQGSLLLEIAPESKESYPLTISFGNEVKYNSEYGVYYVPPTEVNFRE